MRIKVESAMHFFLNINVFIFLLISIQLAFSIPTKTQTEGLCNFNIDSPKNVEANHWMDDPQKGYKDLQIEASIKILVTKFNQSRVVQPKACGFYVNPRNIESSTHTKLPIGYGTTLEKKADRREGNASNDEGISSKNHLAEDFRLIAVKPIGKLGEVSTYDRCTCDIRALSYGEVVKFESLFSDSCPDHVVREESGKQYIRMKHGCPLKSLASFNKLGIKPVGRGDLGQGFYMTTKFRLAEIYGVVKNNLEFQLNNLDKFKKNGKFDSSIRVAITNPKPVMVLEVWVPFGLDVKRYSPSGSDPVADILQHNDAALSNKFLFKAAILSLLEPKKGYVIKRKEITHPLI